MPQKSLRHRKSVRKSVRPRKSSRKSVRKSLKPSKSSRKSVRPRKSSRKSVKPRKSSKSSVKHRKSSKSSVKPRKSSRKSVKPRKSSKSSVNTSDDKHNFKMLFFVSKVDEDRDMSVRLENLNSVPDDMKKVFNDYINQRLSNELYNLNKNRLKVESIKYTPKNISVSVSTENPVDGSFVSDVEVFSDKSLNQVLDKRRGSDGVEYNFESVKVQL